MDRHYRNFPPPLTPRYYGQGVVDKLLDDLRMYGNAFAMVEPHGQDWPATKEEESRMKQIDFSKPLRLNYNGPDNEVEVVKEGVTLVRIMGSLFAVDEHGVIQQTGSPREGVKSFRVENVPEYLHLYRHAGEEWRIDCGDSQIFTKEQAESLSNCWARHAGAKNTVVVKVPV